jgi:hypothetical protein
MSRMIQEIRDIPRDAGLLGLAHEIADTPTDQLREQLELLSEIHPTLRLVARPRLLLVVAELERRGEGRVSA